MKVSFVECDHIGSLMRALKRIVHHVWCTCSFKSAAAYHAAGWLGRCASSLRRWPRVAHQPKRPSSSSWQHFRFASCVVCWWREVWAAPFQGRRITLSLRSLGRENCFAVTRRCFLRTKSEKLFPSRPSFLRRRTSTGFASRRFSRWQSENQKDSRLGRVRIIISDGTYALLNDQQIKMVSREACVCAMCSRTGQGLHVCMHAYLRNLLGSLCALLTKPLLWHCICSIFCSFKLFVNLLCRKPEMESLGFTCNWLVLVGRFASTSATSTYFRVADKFTTAKRKAGTLYHAKSFGYPAIVWLLRRSCTTEGNTSAAAHRTAASLWLRSNLRRCTSEPTPHLYAPPAMFIEVTSAMHIQTQAR